MWHGRGAGGFFSRPDNAGDNAVNYMRTAIQGVVGRRSQPMSETESETTETVNDYEFAVPHGEIPDRPDRLFVPAQLEAALDAHAPDSVTVVVNEQFRRTVARTGRHRGEVEISWDAFEDEDHYGGDGWAVTVSALNHALDARGDA